MRSGLEGVAPAFGGRRFDWQPFVKGLDHSGFVKMSKMIEIPFPLLPATSSKVTPRHARLVHTDACVGQKI